MHPKPDSIVGPVQIERHDLETGHIVYEIWDYGQYHCICAISEDDNDHAKQEAEFVALALNNAIGALRAVQLMTD